MREWVEKRTTARMEEQYENSEWKKDESACASYLWKVLSPCLFSIKDTALVLSQEDDTFSIVPSPSDCCFTNLIFMQMWFFLIFFPMSELNGCCAGWLHGGKKITRNASQPLWALSSLLWYCGGGEPDVFRVQLLMRWYREKRWCCFSHRLSHKYLQCKHHNKGIIENYYKQQILTVIKWLSSQFTDTLEGFTAY